MLHYQAFQVLNYEVDEDPQPRIVLAVYKEKLAVPQKVSLLHVHRTAQQRLLRVRQNILQPDFPGGLKSEESFTYSQAHVAFAFFYWTAWLLTQLFRVFHTELTVILARLRSQLVKIFVSIEFEGDWQNHSRFFY